MPQLGCLNGRISTSIFLRQPPKESLHLPFKLGCIFVHTVLLAAGPTPSPGYYSSSKPGSYSSPYPKYCVVCRHSNLPLLPVCPGFSLGCLTPTGCQRSSARDAWSTP